MKVESTVTFIVSRNYGRALSLSLPARRMYVLAAILALVLAAMVAMSALFVLIQHRLWELEEDLQRVRSERDTLREQVSAENQKALEDKEAAWLALLQGDANGQGDTSDGSGPAGDEQYQPPVRISSYTTRVYGRNVEVSFRILNQGEPDNNRGGFLFAVFEQEDVSPSLYEATPKVSVNEDGFPQTYKSGIRFTRIRDAVTFRRRITRATAEDYFTHVTLYLFSVRGGLLLKDRFELDRDLFIRENPAARTQQLL